MSSKRTRRLSAALTLLLGTQALLAGSATAAPAAGAREGARTAPEVVAELPVGSGPGEVGMESTPEGDWGVTAFAIGPDGRLYLVDGVNDKLVVLDRRGNPQRELPFPSGLVCPEDIAVTDESIYLMDVAVQPGVVCRLSASGAVERTWTVPEDLHGRAVTGIVVQQADGEDVFLEVDGAWNVPLVEDGRPVRPKVPPLVRRTNGIDVAAADAAEFGLRTGSAGRTLATSLDRVDGHDGVVTVFDRGRRVRSLHVRTGGPLAHLKALASDVAGFDYLTIEEYSCGNDGAVESYVQSFDANGVAGARFDLPVDRFVTTPHRPVRVDRSGRVLCLVPGKDAVTVERLATREVVEAKAHETPAEVHSSTLASHLSGMWSGLRAALRPPEAYAIWDQLDASDRANSYVYNSWYCSSANYSRSCGDYRPAYITASGKNYGSVPYCWGGFDTASTFNSAMSSDKDAGDVHTTGSKRSCTAGVDCSGFVTRLWGLTTKRSTNTLDDVSYSINRSKMQCADLYLKPGSHAIAFRYFTGNGDSAVWESTTSSDKDRVVSWVRTASYLADYQTRRYVNW